MAMLKSTNVACTPINTCCNIYCMSFLAGSPAWPAHFPEAAGKGGISATERLPALVHQAAHFVGGALPASLPGRPSSALTHCNLPTSEGEQSPSAFSPASGFPSFLSAPHGSLFAQPSTFCVSFHMLCLVLVPQS